MRTWLDYNGVLNYFQGRKQKPGWKDNTRKFLANLWDLPSVETYVLSKRKSMGIKKPFVELESTGGMQFLKKLVYTEFRTNEQRESENAGEWWRALDRY